MELSVAVAVVALAASVVCHAVVVVGLARKVWWRGLLGAVVPPLGPYWGWQVGLRRSVVAWCLSVLAYALAVAAIPRN